MKLSIRLLDSSNSQSALEFLITYGWAILILVSIVAILFALGILNIPSFVSPAPVITGFNGVVVSEVAANQTALELLLTNNLDINVSINSLQLHYNGSYFTSLECTYLSLSPGQNTLCIIPANFPIGRINFNLGIGYSVSTFLNSTSNGSVLLTTTSVKLAVPNAITTFVQYGFPIGSAWNVTYDGILKSTSASSLAFSTPFGSHQFSIPSLNVSNCTYTPVPGSGSATAGQTVTVAYASSCDVTFIEKNLPSGTSWSAVYNGVGQSSKTPEVVFTSVSSGSHAFTIPSVTIGGCVYSPNPSLGSLSVGQYDVIEFSGVCTTTFTEIGLPSGYTWDVTYNTLQKDASAPSSITYLGSPGTFSYTVATLSNTSSSVSCTTIYTPSPSGGPVSAGSTTTISFTAETNCTNIFSETTLPSGYTWSVNYDGVSGSASTGSSITIKTSQSGSSYGTYTASGSVSGLACTASASVEQGTSYTFSSWTCVTTFNEQDLPSGDTWGVAFNGASQSGVTVPNSISLTTSSATVTATASNSQLDCSATSSPAVIAGSTYTFSPSDWTCTTTFSESGLSSGFPWNVTFAGTSQGFLTGTSTTFTTDLINGLASYSFTPTSANSITFAYGTPAYQGQVYDGLPVQAFPSALSDLNIQTSCSSPYNSEGYSATAYVYFSSSITFTVWTDDGTEIFYQPYGSSSWTSVFGGAQWRGQGTSTSTSPYTATVSVTPGFYRLAVDWTNICGGGMDFIGINGAQTVSPQFNVIAWTPNSNSVQLLPYSDVTANPVSPSAITVQQTGSWANSPFGYISTLQTPSPQSGSVYSGGSVSTAYSLSTNSNTVFYEEGLPSGYTWSVNYDGIGGSASTGSPITISQSNIGSPGSFTASASVSGLACTTSASVTQGNTYTFTSWSCSTTFTESGLPGGFTWSVTYNGNSQSSSSNTIQFSTGAGTFSYSIPSQYSPTAGCLDPSPSSGSLNAGGSLSTTFSNPSFCTPPSISGYLTLTVSNPSGTTSSPFQTMVTVDNNTYSSNIASSFQNVEFFYANGVIIPSWLESKVATGTNSQYQGNFWVKLNGISGGGSETIYMGYASTSTNLFGNYGLVGEAPQLSSSYGQYDDGAQVFNNYWNFAGTSMPGGFSEYTDGGGSVTVNNGLTLNLDNGQGVCTAPTYIGFIYNTPISVGNNIVETYSSGTRTSGPTDVGIYTGNSASSGGYAGVANTWGWGSGTLSGGYGNIGNPFDISSGSGVASIYWVGGGNEGVGWNYIFSSSGNTAESYSSSMYMAIGTGHCSGGSDLTYKWLRTRSYQYDGVSSASYSNPGGLPSGGSYYAYPRTTLPIGFPYSNSGASSCSGFEVASSSDGAHVNGECNWGGGYLNVYFAGGNAGYANFYIYGTSDGIVYAGGSSDNRCLNTGGGSAEITNLYVPAQTLYLQANTGGGGGSCGNGGVLIN